MTWASRHAIVVNGAGSGAGYSKSIPPSGWTVQQLGTGCQKYSSSVRPSSRGRSWVVQWKSSWSASSEWSMSSSCSCDHPLIHIGQYRVLRMCESGDRVRDDEPGSATARACCSRGGCGRVRSSPTGSTSRPAACAATSNGCATWAIRCTPARATAAVTSWARAPRCRRCCSTPTRRSPWRSACGWPRAAAWPASANRRCGR